MKKILILFSFLIVSLTSFAQNVQWYRATSFALNNGYEWSEWYPSNVNICFDLSSDIITIYSNPIQVYGVVAYEGQTNDSSGGTQVKFRIINASNQYGYVRLRIESNGNSQLYVDFPGDGTAICYNVYRKT